MRRWTAYQAIQKHRHSSAARDFINEGGKLVYAGKHAGQQDVEGFEDRFDIANAYHLTLEVVPDPDGNELGRVGQRENEALQNLTDYSIFTDPTLHFRVHDEVSQEEFRLERTSGLGDNTVSWNVATGLVMLLARFTA